VAFLRTVGLRPKLPLSDSVAGPTREGVSRLRGAFLIDITRVQPDPDQPRRTFDEVEMENLTASITERGIKQPVRVWQRKDQDTYQIISGERRYRAALAAGLTMLPCIIDDAPAGAVPPRKEILVDQIVENWQREDLNPYDLSDALKELRDQHGLKQDQIATLTGKPKSEISRFLAMQRVVPEVQSVVRGDESHRFSRRHVVALSVLTPAEQVTMAERIKTENLSAVETERAVNRLQLKKEGKATQGAPVSVRQYVVGSARVKITFRKQAVSTTDILDVLERVKGMVERE
jgi:ParB family transcriptional regulator, chromosome partitioning protein